MAASSQEKAKLTIPHQIELPREPNQNVWVFLFWAMFVVLWLLLPRLSQLDFGSHPLYVWSGIALTGYNLLIRWWNKRFVVIDQTWFSELTKIRVVERPFPGISLSVSIPANTVAWISLHRLKGYRSSNYVEIRATLIAKNRTLLQKLLGKQQVLLFSTHHLEMAEEVAQEIQQALDQSGNNELKNELVSPFRAEKSEREKALPSQSN